MPEPYRPGESDGRPERPDSLCECEGCTFKSLVPRRCPRCGGRITDGDAVDS